MQESSSKAVHQRYREGAVGLHLCYRQINNQSFTMLKDDDSTQVVDHYIISSQAVHAAGPVTMTQHLA